MGLWDIFSLSDSVAASSGNVANANAVATLPAVPNKTNYVTGFQLTAAGATAANTVVATLTGVVGGPLSWVFDFPTGAGVGATPLVVQFPTPLPCTAPNIAAVLTLPASGAGGLNACATIQGLLA